MQQVLRDWNGRKRKEYAKLSTPMVITIQLPDEVAGCLGPTPDAAGRQLLESAAVEGYRAGRLARGQVRKILGLGWHETEEFLARNGCDRHYSVGDLDEDRETLADLPAR
jgi:hypothetical protein